MVTMEKIVALAKRRGFVYPSGEIYGGISGFWDFGPIGVEFSKNIKEAWWKSMVYDRDDIVGLDSSIITNSKVWEASGHVTSFTDPLVECKICHTRMRADQPDEIANHENQHKKEGKSDVSWTAPRQFNLLFRTFVGPIEDNTSQTYLRGETCQGIYINFHNILATTRIRVPFGIAQIGKAFRNEVTAGKFLFRVREFEQMELEYFVHQSEAQKWLEYWKEARMNWHLSLGLSKKFLRFRQHEATERAHYAADSWDLEFEYPDWGYKELEGIANRTDFDLKTHSKHSGKDLSYTDPITNKAFIPYIIEPSVSIQRLFFAHMINAYREDDKRIILQLNPKLSPFKAAVFPLVANNQDLAIKAKEIYRMLKKKLVVAWDDRGNIGKRYLSQDEIGTPWCVTIDYDTLTDDTVTVRDRDTTKQERVPMHNLISYFSTKLE